MASVTVSTKPKPSSGSSKPPIKSRLSKKEQEELVILQERERMRMLMAKAKGGKAVRDSWENVPRGLTATESSVADDEQVFNALHVEPEKTDIVASVLSISCALTEEMNKRGCDYSELVGQVQKQLPQSFIDLLLAKKPGAKMVYMVKKNRGGKKCYIPVIVDVNAAGYVFVYDVIAHKDAAQAAAGKVFFKVRQVKASSLASATGGA